MSKTGASGPSFHQSGDLNELAEIIATFCDDREWGAFHTPKDVAIGVATEGAELLELFRFKSDEQIAAMFSDSSTREKISDEVADVFYWILRFAQLNRIDLGEALKNKMKKNVAKYPIEKARGNNRKYTEY